jgi:hypothetical protein
MRKLTFLPLALGASLALTLGAARAGEPATPPAPPAPPASPASPAPADAKGDAGEVTLKGTLGCGKCSFHEAKACQNVLKVPTSAAAGAKVETYVLADNETSRANHEKVCGPAAPATVTGTVSVGDAKAGKTGKKAGKKILTASSITFD